LTLFKALFFLFERTIFVFQKNQSMALPTKNDKKGKKGNKSQMHGNQGSKFIAKPGKGGGFSQKPHKAGGTRGS
jgi:hypothetical protein